MKPHCFGIGDLDRLLCESKVLHEDCNQEPSTFCLRIQTPKTTGWLSCPKRANSVRQSNGCVATQHSCQSSTGSQDSGERLKKSCVAEWLDEAFGSTLFEQTRAHSFAAMRGNEYDGDLPLAVRQFALKIGAAHSRHGNVEDQTSGRADAIGREKLFRRREGTDRKAELSQQVRKRLADGLIVVDH